MKTPLKGGVFYWVKGKGHGQFSGDFKDFRSLKSLKPQGN